MDNKISLKVGFVEAAPFPRALSARLFVSIHIEKTAQLFWAVSFL